MAAIVKVKYFIHDDTLSTREYTYYSENDLKIGDIVTVPVRDSTGRAKVTAIDVPESEIAAFKDKVKTIPAGAVMQNTKINLCDTCILRNDYPICCAPDIIFGDGKGNDNIIHCSKYANGPAAPCTIPLGIVQTVESQSTGHAPPSVGSTTGPLIIAIPIEIPIAALTLRPGEDIEAHNYFAEASKMLVYAEWRVIKTLDDAKLATDDLSLISKLKKAMEAKRKEKLAPHEAEVKAIRDTYTYLMTPVLEAERITKEKQVAFLQEQERIRSEQEAINLMREQAAQKQKELTGEITEVEKIEVVEPPKRIKTDIGSTGLTDHWVYEVVDFAQVPDTYKVIDSALLNAIARKHHDSKPVPGIKFINKPYLATR